MNLRPLPINSIGPSIRTCQIASGAEIFLCAHSMTLGTPLGRPGPVARRVVAWCVSQRRTPSRWSWHPDERWKLVNPEGGLRFTSDQGVQPEVGSIHTIWREGKLVNAWARKPFVGTMTWLHGAPEPQDQMDFYSGIWDLLVGQLGYGSIFHWLLQSGAAAHQQLPHP